MLDFGEADDQREAYFHDSGAISISAPKENPIEVGDAVSELALYERLLGWSQESRAYDRAYYTDIVDHADTTSMAVLGSVGRALNATAYNFIDGVAGVMGLATDSNLRASAYDNLKTTSSYVWNDPGEAYNDVSGAAVRYYEENDAQQIAEDTLTFGAGLVGGAGIAKSLAAVGKGGYVALKNSKIIFSARSGTINGGVIVPGVHFTRITTVTRPMSERFQGMGYLDPI